ncbi:SDR family NAD(P)-dependent oxidoreductase [Thermodesulfobacteriota bacterium]
MEQYSFAGKNVLITGASGGLGSALAIKLADMGANLVVTSRSMKALEDLISRMPGTCRVEPVTADLSVPGQAAKLAEEALGKVGRVDVIFNNAGIGYFALMEEAEEDKLRYLFELNTFSPLALIKALVPQMKSRGGGRIVNVVSCAGRVPIPTVGVYGGSKSALAIMTNTMRLELEPAGIEIINIYPGTIDDSFEEHALRENKRDGICAAEHCGEPRNHIAQEILGAATGPPGEVWLDSRGKWLSAAALVWPGFVDKRLVAIRDKVVQSKSARKRRWRLLQLESAIACNLTCLMCPWKEIRQKAEDLGIMSQEVWDAIRPYLSEIRSVDFTGGGEPLLQPGLVEWVAEAKSAGCETGILTNGLLLTERKAKELLTAGLDWICVSMDAATAELYEQIREGSDFEKVCENLSNLVRLRNGKLPKAMINFVLMRTNHHHMADIVRLASRLGVDQVNFKQCDVIRREHGKGLGLFQTEKTKAIRRLEKELEKARTLAGKLGIETTSFPFTPTEQPVCDQDPRDSMFVRFDGSVGPCINLAIGGPTTFLGTEATMPEVHYGRLPQDDLGDLWDTDACKFFKKRFGERVKTYEDTFVKSLTGGSTPSRHKLTEAAVKAMPEAPEGCKVCHYLYNV